MKLRELVTCSLPLLAEREDEEYPEYPYWFGGTCFLVRYHGALYSVTAAHCLRDKTKDEVRIQECPDSSTFLTLRALFTQSAERMHGDDPDYDDWAVFQVVEPEDAGDIVAILELDTIEDAPLPTPAGEKLVVRGYPKSISRINYDDRAIVWRAFAGSGVYLEKTSWSSVCHTMLLDDVSEIDDIDGLSGSPVLLLTPHGDGYRPSFAGMVVRGSKESRKVHFLSAEVVRAAVVAAHQGRRL